MIVSKMIFFDVFIQAYYFSPIKNIVGVELNSELCEMQKLIISKRRMQDRVQVFEMCKARWYPIS